MARVQPDPLDRIIGANMRRLRRARDMTETELGNYLPVTFQQIQKYEKGMNSISAADLARLAVGLNCSINEFFAVR
jgi:transcriptional regulator with XRE-family HTH domain